MSLARLFFPTVCVIAAAACKQATPDDPCQHAAANVAAFELHIVPPAGLSVTKMRMTVLSGNSTDVYDDLASTCDPMSSLVCFVATRGDLCAGDGGREQPDAGSEVTCYLWLQGNADLTIEADGYAVTTEHLDLVQDACKNTQTKTVRIELSEPG
jgi:hypothetical protein